MKVTAAATVVVVVTFLATMEGRAVSRVQCSNTALDMVMMVVKEGGILNMLVATVNGVQK